MIKKKIILRLSNELGNQMFMYDSALGIANKLNINLIIDLDFWPSNWIEII